MKHIFIISIILTNMLFTIKSECGVKRCTCSFDRKKKESKNQSFLKYKTESERTDNEKLEFDTVKVDKNGQSTMANRGIQKTREAENGTKKSEENKEKNNVKRTENKKDDKKEDKIDSKKLEEGKSSDTGVNNNKEEPTQVVPDDSSQPLTLSKEKLGNYSWHILHSFAASYPKEPTADEKEAFVNLIKVFSLLYPCSKCRDHFKKLIEHHPPKSFSNRESAVIYVCEIHNFVNYRLNKLLFDCSQALERWGGGDCGCNDTKEKEKEKKV
jgi:hypothetical protein